MKFKKAITATAISIGLISVSVSPASAKEQNVSYYQATNKTYVYNQKGKKTDGWMKKGMVFRTLGTKTIKGKKYYIVGKKRYVLANGLVKYNTQPTQNPKWQSKHLVDTSGDIFEQTKKAYDLQGEERLEAFKEIANEKQMLNTYTGEIYGSLDAFESMIKTDYYNHMEVVTGKPFTDDTLH